MIDMLPPTMPQESSEEFRILTPEEIKTVEYVFLDKGVTLPDPAISQFIGCVKGGKVLAFLVLQIKLHAQPLWIEEGNSHLLSSLVAKAEQVILERTGPQWVYVFTPAGRLTQLAVSMGMQLEPWCVMSKLVTPHVPDKIHPADLMPNQPETTTEDTIQ